MLKINGKYKNRSEIITQALKDAIVYNQDMKNKSMYNYIEQSINCEENIVAYKKLLEEYES